MLRGREGCELCIDLRLEFVTHPVHVRLTDRVVSVLHTHTHTHKYTTHTVTHTHAHTHAHAHTHTRTHAHTHTQYGAPCRVGDSSDCSGNSPRGQIHGGTSIEDIKRDDISSKDIKSDNISSQDIKSDDISSQDINRA